MGETLNYVLRDPNDAADEIDDLRLEVSGLNKDWNVAMAKLDDALGIIHDLLGLELGSSERAMKFLDDNSPKAEDVRGILAVSPSHSETP